MCLCWSDARAVELERQLECAVDELRACQEKLAAATRALQNRLTERYECKICFERAVEAIFLPCGHALCCTACADTQKTCPVCSEGVAAITVVHYP